MHESQKSTGLSLSEKPNLGSYGKPYTKTND